MHPAVNTSQLSLGLSHTIFVKASRTVVSKNRSVRTHEIMSSATNSISLRIKLVCFKAVVRGGV